jgi:hypothetical protein
MIVAAACHNMSVGRRAMRGSTEPHGAKRNGPAKQRDRGQSAVRFAQIVETALLQIADHAFAQTLPSIVPDGKQRRDHQNRTSECRAQYRRVHRGLISVDAVTQCQIGKADRRPQMDAACLVMLDLERYSTNYCLVTQLPA